MLLRLRAQHAREGTHDEHHTRVIARQLWCEMQVDLRRKVSTEMLELQKWKEAKLPKLSSEVELRYIHQRTGEEVYGEKYGFDLEFFNRKMEWALVIGLGKENLFL